jgi:hypothetical protein
MINLGMTHLKCKLLTRTLSGGVEDRFGVRIMKYKKNNLRRRRKKSKPMINFSVMVSLRNRRV